MAVDMFINLGDKIKGDSKDAAQGKKNDCDVLAFSFGMSQSGSFHQGAGGGAGKVMIQDLSFTKYLDAASSALMLNCCKGTHIPKVVLLVRKAGGKAEKELEITMEKVMISSISMGGSGGEDRFTETVTLHFAEVKFENFKQDEKGVTSSAGTAHWDIPGNVAK